MDGAGNVYVTDQTNERVLKLRNNAPGPARSIDG